MDIEDRYPVAKKSRKKFNLITENSDPISSERKAMEGLSDSQIYKKKYKAPKITKKEYWKETRRLYDELPPPNAQNMFGIDIVRTPEDEWNLEQKMREARLTQLAAEEELKARGYEPYTKKGYRDTELRAEKTSPKPGLQEPYRQPKLVREPIVGDDNIRKAFKHKVTGKVLRVLPLVGAGLSGYAALQTGDAGAAIADAIVPGGVESMGRDSDQVELDRQYKERIRERREQLNQLLP